MVPTVDDPLTPCLPADTLLTAGSYSSLSIMPVFSRPTYDVLCQVCRLPMEWKQCQGDDKGNKGRWYVKVSYLMASLQYLRDQSIPKCKTLNAAGKAEGFKWGSPKSSPDISPTESSHVFPTTTKNSGLPLAPSINQDDVKHCAIPGYKNTSIAPDCEHSYCRKHCLALSVCKSKTHKLTNAEHAWMAAINPQLLTPAVHAPLLNLSLTNVNGQLPTGPRSQPSALNSQGQPPLRSNAKAKGNTRGTNEVDLLANTHHPLQLPAVFTTGYAQKELLHQQKDAREVEQHEINQRAASTIQVFDWSKVYTYFYVFLLHILIFLLRMRTSHRSLKFKTPLHLSPMPASAQRSGSFQFQLLSYVHLKWLWAKMTSRRSNTSIHLMADGSILLRDMFLFSPLLLHIFMILVLLSSQTLMMSSKFQL